MPPLRIAALSILSMLAFAGNSIICRAALAHTDIDPASFTSIRLISGALTLLLICMLMQKQKLADCVNTATWSSAFFLFVYAAGFSFAYISLPAGLGALLLFAAVQITMMSVALFRGERLNFLQSFGFIAAIVGVIALFFPIISAPPILGASLMISAGIAWGLYSLRGKGVSDPIAVTTGNFTKSLVFSLPLSLVFLSQMAIPSDGVLLALLSGIVTSAVGYSIWYQVLPHLNGASAASMQLTVPVIAIIIGVLLLNESISAQQILASIIILGGVAMVIFLKSKPAK